MRKPAGGGGGAREGDGDGDRLYFRGSTDG